MSLKCIADACSLLLLRMRANHKKARVGMFEVDKSISGFSGFSVSRA